MKDLEIKVNSQSGMINLKKSVIGNDGENLQGKLIFMFEDNFVNGQARLEYQIECKKYWIPLEKVGESYQVPIKSVLTREGRIDMQLVITQGIDPEEIPIFKSNMFYVYCNSSLNVIMNEPDKYNEWLERANTILNQMDNYDIEAIQEEKGGKVTITKKDGTKKTIQLSDGATFTPSLAENGDLSWTNDMGKPNPKTINIRGPQGPTYELTDKDRLEIGNIASSNAESTFKKYYDGKVEDFNTNATDKTSDFDSNATNQVEAYNTNATNKTSAYNENTIAKTKSFNENATQKTSDYDLNHTNKLKEYNDNDTTKTNAFNSNATQKTTAFNENAQKKTDDFNQIASDYDERINENKKGIDRNSKRIENVETALYKKGEASGEFINIQDSALSEVKDIKGSINKAQDTTEGYNLLNINTAPSKTSNAWRKIEGDNLIVTGNSTKDWIAFFIKVKPNTDYTIWFQKATYKMAVYDTSVTKFINDLDPDFGSRTFNTKEYEEIALLFYGTTTYEKPMLVEGKLKPYEPYTGGIPAPNPEYQREIAKQSGVVEITSCGKNLAKCLPFRQVSTAQGYPKPANWEVTINNSTNNSVNFSLKQTYTGVESNFIKLKKGQTFFVNAKTRNLNKLFISQYDLNKVRINELSAGSISYEKHTMPEDGYITICFASSTVQTDCDVSEIQLEIGNKPTPYEPYQSITEKVDLKENVMLPKDDLVRLINPQDNKLWWYLKKNYNERLLNGNEGWANNGETTSRSEYVYDEIGKKVGQYNLKSNYFIATTEGDNRIAGRTNSSKISISITKNIIPTLDANLFKNWLKEKYNSGKPVELVYELETPELIPLQPVQNFNMTYNPITNIFSNRVNLLLDVSYNRDFVYTIKNLQVDKDTLENQLKDLETRVLALENKPATINESEVISNEDLRS